MSNKRILPADDTQVACFRKEHNLSPGQLITIDDTSGLADILVVDYEAKTVTLGILATGKAKTVNMADIYPHVKGVS